MLRVQGLWFKVCLWLRSQDLGFPFEGSVLKVYETYIGLMVND